MALGGIDMLVATFRKACRVPRLLQLPLDGAPNRRRPRALFGGEDGGIDCPLGALMGSSPTRLIIHWRQFRTRSICFEIIHPWMKKRVIWPNWRRRS